VITASREVKFRLVGGAQPLLLVPVNVNGAGPFEFILDTGAGTTILTPEIAARLKLQSTGSKQGHTAGGVIEAKLATLESISVGASAVENVDIAIAELSHLSKAVGAKIDGDLGYNFLKHFRLAIDYRNGDVRFDDPKRVEYFGTPALTELPMRLAHPAKPLILIDAQVDGRGPFLFAIDTGTSTTAVSRELASILNLSTAAAASVTTGAAAVQMSAARLPTLRVGKCEIRDVDVIVGDFLTMLSGVVGAKLDGIIGYNFLRHFKVVLDYPGESFSLFAA